MWAISDKNVPAFVLGFRGVTDEQLRLVRDVGHEFCGECLPRTKQYSRANAAIWRHGARQGRFHPRKPPPGTLAC
jgi:hypothetical protein